MDIKPYLRKVNYYETDQMAIVHHSNYIRWFEEARVDFMDQIGFSYTRAMEADIDLAVIESYMAYKSMVRYGETVSIVPQITYLTAARMRVDYRVTDSDTGILRTLGYTRHCFYDGVKQCPISLKKALPELFSLFDSLKVTLAEK